MEAKVLLELHRQSQTSEEKPIAIDVIEAGHRTQVYIEESSYDELISKHETISKLNLIGKTFGKKEEEKQEAVGIGKIIDLSQQLVEKTIESPTEPKKQEEEILKEQELLKAGKKEFIKDIFKGLAKKEIVKEAKAPEKEEQKFETIEEKEKYEKVKKGVGIAYIDHHIMPVLNYSPPSEKIEDRTTEVIEEIIEKYNSSKTVSKAEISKKLLDMTKAFLQAARKEDREKIKKEIVELKESLKAKEEKKEVDPLLLLAERQKASMQKEVDDLKRTYEESLQLLNSSYEEAKSLASSKEILEKIEKLKEGDTKYLDSSFESLGQKSLKYIIELHSNEVKILGEKLSLNKEKVVEKINEINNSYPNFIPKNGTAGPKKEYSDTNEKGPGKNEIQLFRENFAEKKEPDWIKYLAKRDKKSFIKYENGALFKEDAIKLAKELYIVDKAEELKLPKALLEKAVM